MTGSLVKLYRSATPFNGSEDPETRITEAALLFFKKIITEPSDGNPEILEDFAAEWPKACKADVKVKKRKLSKSLAAKQAKQGKERAKMADGEHAVQILPEETFGPRTAYVSIFAIQSLLEVRTFIQRQSLRGGVAQVDCRVFRGTRVLPKYKLSCVWLPDTKQRFGNICRLGKRGSYIMKASLDTHGVLHNSFSLGRPFEDRELHVVRRECGQDKPPLRNTWKQLHDEWDATDRYVTSSSRFQSATTDWDVSGIHRQEHTSFMPRLNSSASISHATCHTPTPYRTLRLSI
ncbi:hypothetical protein DFH09DRAFT_1095414 [Mycena vulgaris]|nr:hypothetical protein DFH09DRAFT_1095414 [Mycena vulgaris]